jgi:DNA processing protein
MASAKERAAVLALTRATRGPWHHTSRAVEARGSALRLMDGDFAGLDEDDRAHAAEVVSRLRPGDLAWAEDLALIEESRLVTVLDEDYPGNLAFVHNFQPFLWVRGRLRADDYRSVAVAGERDVAHAREAAHAVTEAGLTVVGGLDVIPADGIAVLPHGIAVPPQNATVAKEIADHGALVSAFWPATPPDDRTVALSRIVTSGLAAVLYVTDGREGGPAAAQMAMALGQGKHVFVPRRLHEDQSWVRRLAYRGGVTVVEGIDDMLSKAVNLVDVTRQPTVF